MARIRIGSVGIGGISRHIHLPGIERSPDLELVAVCDVDPAALEYAKDKYGIKPEYCFSDYRDLVNCPIVDAVDISTPNCVHFEVAMAAISAGKSYCLEKPITIDAAQADILAKETKDAGVKSMVCFSYRYMAAARCARDLVQTGVLGKIYHIDMQYYQAWGIPRYDTAKVWRFDKALAGSGAMGDLGSHGLDLMRFVSGQEYTRVAGHTRTFTKARRSISHVEMEPVDVDDFSNAMCDMSGGAAATMRITRFAYGRGNYQTLEIYGDKGALVYTLDANGQGKDELQICLDPLGADNNQFVDVRVPFKYRMDQMQSFADLINDKGDNLNATIEDGRINMHTIDAILKSADDGVWLDVK